MSVELMPYWEVLVGLGVILTLIGLALAAAKRRSGWMVTLIGVAFLVSFGIYLALLFTGIYGKVAAAGYYIPNLIGAILVIIGIGIWIKISREKKEGVSG
ncbi:MAG TPA: hypothetical protein ENF33_03370 [Nitrososphaeria archaeon]|nr:hypothetical protein [Nitrososphaeria archaeon]